MALPLPGLVAAGLGLVAALLQSLPLCPPVIRPVCLFSFYEDTSPHLLQYHLVLTQ